MKRNLFLQKKKAATEEEAIIKGGKEEEGLYQICIHLHNDLKFVPIILFMHDYTYTIRNLHTAGSTRYYDTNY